MGGYAGRIGVSSIPAETPREMWSGPPEACGDAMEIAGPWVEGEALRAEGIPSDILGPVRLVVGASPMGGFCMGWGSGMEELVAATGIAVLGTEEAEGSACSMWIGGFGGGGTNTGSVSMRDTRRSG